MTRLPAYVLMVGMALNSVPVGAATSADIGPVTGREDATRYLDAVFAAAECRITEAGLLKQMRADKQSPSKADRANPGVNTDKQLRHRWIFKTLQEMVARGEVCADSTDPALSIAKFGACA